MDIVQKNPLVATILLVVGIVLGLVYGWFVDPIEWEFSNPQQIAIEACEAATKTDDVGLQAQYEAAALAINSTGCATVPVPAESGGNPLVFAVLAFLIVVFALFILMRRRNDLAVDDAIVSEPAYADMPDAGPVGVELEEDTIPIARFRTSYAFGHDNYDDSFSIEDSIGDFLGECGVTVAESIGTDTPKSITAFEVWLFDKNDIRTLTKVIMSEHAFFDDAIKAKLAPKGEPVLAQSGETVVLETASLIINAQITEMEYGDGVLPPKSFFERFAVELSAWAKEGDFEPPDLTNRVDELLNF